MRKTVFTLLIILGLAPLFATAHAENWDRFRGPNGLGVAADKNIPVSFDERKNVLWKLPLPGLGNSSPIIWGKFLFLQTASADGTQRLLQCIDVTEGKELWSRGIPAAKVKVHDKNTLASSTPVTDGQAVFVSFWDGKDIFLVAYNFKGDVLWNKPMGYFSSQHGAGASPILFRDKVIFYNDMDKDDFKTKQPMPRPATLYALNKKTGDVVWELPREAFRACYTAPFILEQPGTPPQLIVTSTTSIASYNPDNGVQNWDWQWNYKRMLRTIGGTLYLDGTLFACSGDGDGSRHMSAIALNGVGKKAKPKQVWANSKDFPYVPCLLSRGDHLYFVNDLGSAGCYQARTGKRAWFQRKPDATYTASPLLIGAKIYAPSEQGDVVVFSATPDAYQEITRNHMGEAAHAHARRRRWPSLHPRAASPILHWEHRKQ